MLHSKSILQFFFFRWVGGYFGFRQKQNKDHAFTTKKQIHNATDTKANILDYDDLYIFNPSDRILCKFISTGYMKCHELDNIEEK